MNYSMPTCRNWDEFLTTSRFLSEFGGKGQEYLELVSANDGTYLLKAGSRERWSWKGFLVRLCTLNTLCYEPEEKQRETVAQSLCEFMEKNQDFLMTAVSQTKLPINELSKFDRLFPDKTSTLATRFFSIKVKLIANRGI
jgi:hypothetical protein